MAEEKKGVKCRVSLLTTTEEQRFAIVRQGELFLSDGKVEISYSDDKTKARFFTDGKTARWVRTGEMDVTMDFDPKKATEGTFGEGGFAGRAVVETHSLSTKEKKDSFVVDLSYATYFDCGKQEMQVRILVKPYEATDFLVS